MATAYASGAPAGRRGLAILVGYLVSTLEGYDLQVISSAGPQLKQLLQLSDRDLGIFFSATLIGLAIGAIVGGWLGDRFGRKPTLVWSLAALGVFTLSTTFVNSYEGLLVTRILAGIGLGGAMPTLIAIVAEVSGGRNTTSAVTTMICGHPTGGIISALVGQTIAVNYGWHSLFLVGGILTLLIVPLVIWTLPETKGGVHTAHAAAMPAGRAMFGDGRAPGTLLLWLIFILTLALLSTLLSWTPSLIKAIGLPPFVQYNAVICMNVGGILGSLAASQAIERYGVRWPLLALYLITAVGLYFFAHSDSAVGLLILAGVVGFGVLGAQFSLYGVAPRLYPYEGRSAGVGAAVALGRIGAVMGPILIGGYLQGGATADQAVLIMAPVAVVAGVALWLLTQVDRHALSAQPIAAPQQ